MHILPIHVTVNQLAKKIRYLSCSFARKGSQEKTLRIGWPPSEMHLWVTSISECHPFAFSRLPYVSVQFSLILPCHSFFFFFLSSSL